MILTDSNDSKF